MAITASDIHNQSFSIDRKGYDVDEVDVFLEHVADEIDALNERIAELEDEAGDGARFDGLDVPVDVDALEDTEEEASAASENAANAAELEARIAELEGQLAEKKANDSAISQALIIAQRSADDIVARAKEEAAETVADAKEEAQRIIDRANNEKQGIVDAIHRLEDDREDTREEYEDMLKDFIEDATHKLASLGGSLSRPTHARPAAARAAETTAANEPVADKPADEPGATGQMLPIADGRREEPVAYTTPQVAGAVVAAATPAAAPMEKDLSGFGDVDSDDFDFEELD